MPNFTFFPSAAPATPGPAQRRVSRCRARRELGGQQWNARTYVTRPALIDGSTCTHAIHRLFTRFSTGLPTATRGKPVAKRQLSLLIPCLSSAYPQAYAQTYPQCGDKRRDDARGERQSKEKAATGACQAAGRNLPTAYARACTQAYPLLVQRLTHIVIHK